MKKKRIITRGADMHITTMRKLADGDTVAHTSRHTVDDLPEHPAYVGLDRGVTVNTGSFSSAKFNVSVRVPCHRNKIKSTYAKVSRLVSELLETERDMLDD